MSRLADIAREFRGRGGKFLRPRLCRAVFAHELERACRNGAVPKCPTIAPVSEAVECFHKASLIHDDIQDGDETRYGFPTVWKQYGVPVAIAAGDWLVAHGYRLIATSGFDAVPAMLSAVVESHVNLCEGQGDDLLGSGTPAAGTDDYLSVCERKTGEAFALAAELGALAAGADPTPWRAYGLAYGVLFQIDDDRADGDDSEQLLALRAVAVNRLEQAKAALGLDHFAF